MVSGPAGPASGGPCWDPDPGSGLELRSLPSHRGCGSSKQRRAGASGGIKSASFTPPLFRREPV